jgi:SAM-dependent methyltransferase
MNLSDNSFRSLFVCPYSLGPLIFEDDRAISKITNDVYPINEGRIDLRLKRPKTVSMDFKLGEHLSTDDIDFKPIEPNPQADVNFDDLAVPHHLSRAILSYFPKAKSENSFALDLGCGTGFHKQVCERAGYKYLGMDYGNSKAPFWADAHALPFPDNSIDFVISISVMEHIQYPWVMAKEVMRVLKPGGRFIGTLSFLEPFHDMSYYHSSHLGVLNTLKIAGFEKFKVLSPNKGWEGIEAVSIMHYFSTMPWTLIKIIIYPYNLMHRIWWKIAEITKRKGWHPFNSSYRLLASSGSFIFVVDK